MTGNTEKLTQSHQTPGQNEQAGTVYRYTCVCVAQSSEWLCGCLGFSETKNRIKPCVLLCQLFDFVFAFLMALNFALMALINPSPKSTRRTARMSERCW